ncbi:MAG: IS66 family transposase [Deinococcales bacterium]
MENEARKEGEREEQLKELLECNEELKRENAELKREVEELKREVEELKRELGKNSKNSDKAPSSDGYRKKKVEVGIAKEGKKAKGGQEGHKGRTLEQVSEADYVELHSPRECERCGREFREGEVKESGESRQVYDLPKSVLEVTEHRLGEAECCGMLQRGEYPREVRASVQYGARVRALVTKLSIDHRLPMKQISQMFADQYGYEINSSTIEDILERGYKLAEELEVQIKERLKASELLHVDETGLRVSGKLQWLHGAATDKLTYLFIHPKRGKTALEAPNSILKDFRATMLHDCWASYFGFSQAKHALCGSHLLRELKALWEAGSAWAASMHSLLLKFYHMPRPLHDPQVALDDYRLILAQADIQEPPPFKALKGRPKQSKGRNLLERLRKYETAVLAFALEPNIPFTNNQIERDLRPAKVKQKVSTCFRTDFGAVVFARLQSLVSTFRKQGLNVFSSFVDLFSHKSIKLLL